MGKYNNFNDLGKHYASQQKGLPKGNPISSSTMVKETGLQQMTYQYASIPNSSDIIEHASAMIINQFDPFDWKTIWNDEKAIHPYLAFLTLTTLSKQPNVAKKLMGTQGNAKEWTDNNKGTDPALSYFKIAATKKDGKKQIQYPKFITALEKVVDRALSIDPAEFNYLQTISKPPAATSLRGWEFLLEVDITVDRTLFSRDDRAFSPLENNAAREWAFHVPIYKASGFSGVFRNALWHRSKSDGSAIDSDDIDRLMGQKNEDEGPQSHEADAKAPRGMGWLHFYPLFFQKTEMDILTPLNSKSRFPEQGPIDMEGIARGQKASLRIGYFPLQTNLEEASALKDLKTVAQICKDLIDVLGVGAKRNSGYGALSFDKWTLSLGGNYKACLEKTKEAFADIKITKINLISNSLG